MKSQKLFIVGMLIIILVAFTGCQAKMVTPTPTATQAPTVAPMVVRQPSVMVNVVPTTVPTAMPHWMAVEQQALALNPLKDCGITSAEVRLSKGYLKDLPEGERAAMRRDHQAWTGQYETWELRKLAGGGLQKDYWGNEFEQVVEVNSFNDLDKAERVLAYNGITPAPYPFYVTLEEPRSGEPKAIWSPWECRLAMTRVPTWTQGTKIGEYSGVKFYAGKTLSFEQVVAYHQYKQTRRLASVTIRATGTWEVNNNLEVLYNGEATGVSLPSYTELTVAMSDTVERLVIYHEHPQIPTWSWSSLEVLWTE